MQLELGQKIRELRHRDGRTQEMLADALGVTSQAISRWEANGGYPDLALIPSIANYFNISIDELFGYSKERQEKLKSIIDQAEEALNAQIDMTETVKMLRSAAEEFPSEPQVLVKLGYALSLCGWQKFGGRSYTVAGSDYAHEDTEYNSQNTYWQEEVKVFEKALSMDIPQNDRDTITRMLVEVCAKMGYTEKAKALAFNQASLDVCREILLTRATDADEQDRYQGEAIIALLSKIKSVIWYSVMTKVSLFTDQVGRDILLSLAHFYEAVFSDGRCGEAHNDLTEIYLTAALNEARFGGDIDQAAVCFEKAFDNHKAFENIDHTVEYNYSAPLVSRVILPAKPLSPEFNHYWERHFIGNATDELKQRLMANPKFAECFVE